MGMLVTGMHRSGTSAVARVVKSLGFKSGDALMKAAPDNPRGFFERVDVMNVNDRWLASLGGSWWAPPQTTQATWRHLDNATLDRDRKELGLFDPSGPAWFVKDPRISLLLPLWDRLTYEQTPSVIVVRDPREVMASLQLRNGMTSLRSLSLWFAYVQAAISASVDRQVLIIDFDALIQSPSHSIEALSQFSRSNFKVDVDQPTVESLTRLIEPLLRRNYVGGNQGLPASVIDEALDVYSHLAKSHAEQAVRLMEFTIPPWASDILDELRETYAQQISAAQASETIHKLERSLEDSQENIESRSRIVSALQKEIALKDSDLFTVRDDLHQAITDWEASKTAWVALESELEAKDQQLKTESHLRQVQEINHARELQSQAARENQVILSLSEDLARATTSSYRNQSHLDQANQEICEIQNLLNATQLELAESKEGSRNLHRFLVQALTELQGAQLAQHDSHVEQIAESSRKWLGAKRLLRWASAASKPGHPHAPILTHDPESVVTILESGLFDHDWYVEQYSDIAESNVDPLLHFMVQGWQEGRSPGPKFDLVFYQQTYLNAETEPANPVLHYLFVGKGKAFSPLPKCDSPTTPAESRDIILIRDSGLFDPAWYCEQYGDVAESGIDPLNHFANHGWREGRNPGPRFNTSRYREVNLLFSLDSINPLIHYLRTELGPISQNGEKRRFERFDRIKSAKDFRVREEQRAMNIVLIANCQGQAIADLLLAAPRISNVCYVPIHILGTQNYESAYADANVLMEDSGTVVLTMPLELDHGDLATESLRRRVNAVMTFTNVHFSGLHPDMMYLGVLGRRIPSPVGDYHSKITVDSFLLGLTVAETYSRFTHEEFGRIGYLNEWEKSAMELLERDKSLDVRFANDFLELTKRVPTLYTINHPTPIALASLTRRLANAIDVQIPSIPSEMLPNYLSSSTWWPIHQAIAAANDIKYSTPPLYRTPDHLGGKWLSPSEFISESFQIYEELESDIEQVDQIMQLPSRTLRNPG